MPDGAVRCTARELSLQASHVSATQQPQPLKAACAGLCTLQHHSPADREHSKRGGALKPAAHKVYLQNLSAGGGPRHKLGQIIVPHGLLLKELGRLVGLLAAVHKDEHLIGACLLQTLRNQQQAMSMQTHACMVPHITKPQWEPLS